MGRRQERGGGGSSSCKRKAGSPEPYPAPQFPRPLGVEIPKPAVASPEDAGRPRRGGCCRTSLQGLTGGTGTSSILIVVSRHVLLAKRLQPLVLPSVKRGHGPWHIAGQDWIKGSKERRAEARLFVSGSPLPPRKQISPFSSRTCPKEASGNSTEPASLGVKQSAAQRGYPLRQNSYSDVGGGERGPERRNVEKEAFHTRPLPAHARCHSRPPPRSARSLHATPASLGPRRPLGVPPGFLACG